MHRRSPMTKPYVPKGVPRGQTSKGGSIMLNKNKNNDIHGLIMDQLTDVENTLVALEGFMAAATADGATIEPLRALCKTVREKEHIADVSLRTMIEGLDGPFLPNTRSDLISIATSCDKIANKCEDVAKLMVYQRFFFPEACNAPINEIVEITKKQFELLKSAVSQLFGKFNTLVKNHAILDDIRGLESQVDGVEEQVYQQIFDMDELALSQKLQAVNFLDIICDISDIIENVADQIQIMLINRIV